MLDHTQPTPPRRSRSAEAAVPLWALGFAAALFAIACLSLWAFVVVSRPTVPRSTSSPVFIVLTNSAASTPDLLSVTATLPGDFAPTGTVPPVLNPGAINLGSYVQVVRTDGDPLKLRQAPTLNAEVNYLAVPNEVLKVINGPTIADGFTWWYLVDPADETRNGWAVENYLDATNGP
ncbi:MAG: hypothetical protein AAB427_00210 [Chloroflexota bacterium]